MTKALLFTLSFLERYQGGASCQTDSPARYITQYRIGYGASQYARHERTPTNLWINGSEYATIPFDQYPGHATQAESSIGVPLQPTRLSTCFACSECARMWGDLDPGFCDAIIGTRNKKHSSYRQEEGKCYQLRYRGGQPLWMRKLKIIRGSMNYSF